MLAVFSIKTRVLIENSWVHTARRSGQRTKMGNRPAQSWGLRLAEDTLVSHGNVFTLTGPPASYSHSSDYITSTMPV